MTITLAACGTTSPDWDTMAKWDSVLLGSGERNFCSGTIIGGGTDQAGEYSIILTAAHCANSDKHTVTRNVSFAGGVIVDTEVAVLLGKDEAADVAIFRSAINRGGTCVPLERNATYTRGDEVYALANPFIVFYASLTKGIISAPARSIMISAKIIGLFQVDAQGAPGSSGGAVLNRYGYLIGTVTGGAPGTSIGLVAPVLGAIALIDKLNIGEHVCYGNS